ncbi:MAG TPA: hypothetical protein PKD24_07510 [Pyrinomonadaceae bacterium]|nr:hypothetical protein [Pyrinomonadaceae bacterium]
MSEVVLKLPDDLAKEAAELGIFRPTTITSLIKEAVRRRKVNKLFETMDRLNAVPEKPTEDEIAAEIDAYRREKRNMQRNP